MRQIFPLLIILLGFAGGLLVNFIVEWLYRQREFLPPEINQAMMEMGWWKYLLWPWSCTKCETRKKVRVTLVNLLGIGIALWLWYAPPLKVDFWWGFPLLLYFMVVVVMDFEYKAVLIPVSYAGAVIGVILGSYLRGFWVTVEGGIIGFGLMFAMYKFGELYTRRIAKKRGEDFDEAALGFGDVNLSGVIGLILGWPGVIVGLFLGVLLGGIFSLLYLVVRKATKRYQAYEAIAYAPYLVLGTVLLLYFRNLFQ